MTKLFFTISVCVVVLNVLLMLIPESTYTKYSKTICGVISVAVIIGTIAGTDIDFTLSERYLTETFSVEEAQSVALKQGAKILEENVKNELENNFAETFQVSVTDDGEKLTKLKIVSQKGIDREKIIDVVLTVCKGERENIIVEYKE